MTKPTKDGGYAFARPSVEITDEVRSYGQTGMTLRDYFAGQAIIALWLNEESHQCAAKGATSDSNATDRMALGAYALADRMLKAREVES